MLIETPPMLDLKTAEGETLPALAAELAWCLRRFVDGRADEWAMRRAEQALADWQTWVKGATVDALG
ncbi:MAG TPA: hypothetical protein VHL53_17885 [Acidimicrobiia bacterium]|nr:hypothetical protein [Acidimicrobiia bacterium]